MVNCQLTDCSKLSLLGTGLDNTAPTTESAARGEAGPPLARRAVNIYDLVAGMGDIAG